MLPAANRLRTAADFRATTRRGTKVTRGPIVLYLAASAMDHPPRVGLIVGKAVGGSVQRHRAARRIRGSVAPLMNRLPWGSRLVIRALPGAVDDPQLAEHLAAGIDRAVAGRSRQ